jgi:hypothetical protein
MEATDEDGNTYELETDWKKTSLDDLKLILKASSLGGLKFPPLYEELVGLRCAKSLTLRKRQTVSRPQINHEII